MVSSIFPKIVFIHPFLAAWCPSGYYSAIFLLTHPGVEVVVLVQEADHDVERLLDGRQRSHAGERGLALLANLQVLF